MELKQTLYTKELVKQLEDLGDSDLVSKELHQKHYSMHIFYIRTICDVTLIRQELIRPFTEKDTLDEYGRYLDALPETAIIQTLEECKEKLYEGNVLLLSDNLVWCVQARMFEGSTIKHAEVERVLQGPLDAYTGDLDSNINMVRNRYNRASLKVKTRKVGQRVDGKIVLIYDEEVVKQSVLAELEMRLDCIQADVVQSAGHLQRLLSARQRYAPFPDMIITERPDRTVLNLTMGKVILMMEGGHFALIAPSVFFDFISSMDDMSFRKPVSYFLNLLRYLAIFITVGLPAFYVAVATYNPELFRIQLTLIVAGTRSSVPYPPFLEVMFMLVMMELLTEGSARLPKAIGPAATTVGGLILGNAATQVGLVGNIMISIVAAVALSNFVVPIGAMSYAIRIIKYPLLLLAGMFGLYGISVGLIGLLMYMVNLESYGEPYMRIFRWNQSQY